MINELEASLKQSLSWNKPTTTCLVQILMAVISLSTVNLKKLACGIKGEAALESQYRRLQRFFARVTFPAHALAKLLAGLFFCLMRPFIFRWIAPIGNGVNRT